MSHITAVPFGQDTLFAVEQDEGVFVAVKPISDSLGLDWKSQHRRIRDDHTLSKGMVIMRMPSIGGVQETLCLPLELTHGWLFTIDDSRVKDDEVREKVLAYKRECYRVLFEHFHGKAQMAVPPASAEVPDGEAMTADAVKLRKVNTAIRCFGEKAGAELWLSLGLDFVPSMLVRGRDPRQGDLMEFKVSVSTSRYED